MTYALIVIPETSKSLIVLPKNNKTLTILDSKKPVNEKPNILFQERYLLPKTRSEAYRWSRYYENMDGYISSILEFNLSHPLTYFEVKFKMELEPEEIKYIPPRNRFKEVD